MTRVYIDAGHTYDCVKKDLEICKEKVKTDGYVGLHDYIMYDFYNKAKYGVVEAVNEFCNKFSYEFVYFAFQSDMFNSVVLRKIAYSL